MFANKLTTATLAVVLVLAAAVPAAAVGGQADAGGTASQSITVTITTDASGTTMTFEQAGEAYSDATVDVEAVGDASYRGSGSYETDAFGQVHLPAPEQDVPVRVDVETENAAASGVVTVSAYHGVESETTAVIDAEAAAEGEAGAEDGSESAADGRADGSAAAEASADANGDGHVSLGERLASFVRSLVPSGVGGIGDAVSDFALGNNPSDADDGARAGADANAGANASADVRAGNGSADVGVGADVGANASSDAGASANASAEANADGEGEGSGLFGLFG